MSKQHSEPLGLIPTSLRTRFNLLAENPLQHIKYLPKFCKMLATSLLLTPVDVLENTLAKNKIKAAHTDQPHLFILGHWRSGTTHLHNLITCDPQFAYPSTLQVTFPKSFLTLQHFKTLLERLMPKTRGFDNVKLSLDFPQEDEVALAYLTPFSIYHCFSYPSKLQEYCDRFVTLKKATDKEIKIIEKAYQFFLQKVMYATGSKPLALKNPINTGRIPLLLKLFPNAKFIYIYRNPYQSCLSEIEAYTLMTNYCRLEDISREDIENSVIHNYKKIIDTYYEDKSLIPSNQLIEMKFEDLIKDPHTELAKVYNHLHLGNYSEVQGSIEQYFKSQATYTRNHYHFSAKIIKKINYHCQSILNHLDYPKSTSSN